MSNGHIAAPDLRYVVLPCVNVVDGRAASESQPETGRAYDAREARDAAFNEIGKMGPPSG